MLSGNYKPLIIICLDGISWDYIKASHAPFLDELGREGLSTTCSAMVPTVTNVNNASIITGAFPERHGISSNWYYDEKSGAEVYMDSSSFLTCPTLLEKWTERGERTLLLTVKDKLRRLLARNVTDSYSTEMPSERIVRELGHPPPIYSLESSPWILSATRRELEKRRWDTVYVSTTDYIPHKHAPKDPEAKEYVSRLDEEIGKLFDLGAVLGVVADHGMNRKTVNIDLSRMLSEEGIESKFVPAIKDEHVVHHGNLGGSAYLYVEKVEKALDILVDAEGVEQAITREAAAKTFRLPKGRIGDLLVLADEKHTFGPNDVQIYADVDVRSHGSLHELDVPFILSRRIDPIPKLHNKDVIPLLTAN